jgi:hypothetical protein
LYTITMMFETLTMARRTGQKFKGELHIV